MSARRRRNSSERRSSVERSSTRRRSIQRSEGYEPTEAEVMSAAGQMDFQDIRNSGIWKEMPSSFKINGRKVPKSQLRKMEAVRFFLQYSAGEIIPRKQKELKLWTPPRKISQEERAKARLEVQKTKDHHGSTKRSSHRRASREPSERKPSSSRRPSLSKRTSSTKKHAPAKRKSSSRRADSLERYMQKLRVQEPVSSDSDSEAEDSAEQRDKPEEDELEEDSEEVTFI